MTYDHHLPEHRVFAFGVARFNQGFDEVPKMSGGLRYGFGTVIKIEPELGDVVYPQ
jgi:hypothetical protein